MQQLELSLLCKHKLDSQLDSQWAAGDATMRTFHCTEDLAYTYA